MLKDALALIDGALSVTELTGDVARSISGLELFDSSRETMVDAFMAKYKEVTNGQKMTKRAVDLITAYNYARTVTKEGCPEWAAPFVFCSEKEGSFINIDNMVAYGTKTFNMMYSARLITDVMKAQGKLHPYVLPTDLLVNAELVEKVSSVRYSPGDERIMEQDGVQLLNTYRACTVEPVDEMLLDEGGEAAVALWKGHLDWLLGPEHAKVLTQFMAYVVQNPGKRVRWAFLMRGPEGCGKTMIVHDLLRSVLGNTNVDVLGNETLMYVQFNDWADSRQVCMVEEVYVEGRAKWDVMNVLKPAITNDVIAIHPKGRPKYTTRNVTSYIMGTNHANALPIVAMDRRYYVCSSRWHGLEFIDDLGGRAAARKYFIKLAAAARDHADALAGWLQGVSLKGFDAYRALATQSKAQMVQDSKSDLQVAVEAALDGAAVPTVNRNVVELESLKLILADEGEAPTGQSLGRMLRMLGFETAGVREMGAVGSRKGTLKSHWAVAGIHAAGYTKAVDKVAFLRKFC
jgi:hypothetical protein